MEMKKEYWTEWKVRRKLPQLKCENSKGWKTQDRAYETRDLKKSLCKYLDLQGGKEKNIKDLKIK